MCVCVCVCVYVYVYVYMYIQIDIYICSKLTRCLVLIGETVGWYISLFMIGAGSAAGVSLIAWLLYRLFLVIKRKPVDKEAEPNVSRVSFLEGETHI